MTKFVSLGRNPIEWMAQPLLLRLERLRVHYCTGPCGQSSTVLNERSGADQTLREAIKEIERLTRERDCYWSIADTYLTERQEMRNLLPECLEEFGPDLLTALKNALKGKP